MGDGRLWEREEGGIVHIDGRVVDGIGQTGSHKKETLFGTVDWGGEYKVYMSRHLFGYNPSCW